MLRGLLCFFSIAAVSLAGQTPELSHRGQAATDQTQKIPTFRSASRLVNVYVVVTDKMGRPMQGLNEADFQVFDNDQPQKIASFATAQDLAANSNAVRALPPSEYTNDAQKLGTSDDGATIILFDTINTAYLSQAYSLEKIRILLRQLSPDDRVGIYVLNKQGLKIVYPPQQPATVLIEAMNRHDAVHSHLDASKASAKGENSTGLLELDRFLKGKEQRQPMAKCDPERFPITIAGLQEIVRNTSAFRGRKAIVWVTEHLPLPFYDEADENAIDIAANTRFCGLQYFGPNLLLEEPPRLKLEGDSDRFRPSPISDSASSSRTGSRHSLRDRPLSENDQLDLLLRMLIQNNVALYPVSAEGLQTVQLFGSHGMDSTAPIVLDPWEGGMPMVKNVESTLDFVANVDSYMAMDRLAQYTGGRAYYDRNDLQTGIRRALDDAKYGYELADYPDHDEWNGDWHKIQVKVNRPGVTVLARGGYYAFPEPKRLPPKASKQLLAEVAASPLEDTEIPITVRLKPPDSAGSSALDPYVYLSAQNLFTSRLGGGLKSDFEVLFFQLTDKSKVLDVTTQNVTVDLNESKYGEALKHGINTHQPLQLKPGATLLYVIVHDKHSDAVGSVRIPLDKTAAKPGR